MPEKVIITGGTSGIGFELAKCLIQKKYCLYFVGRDFEKFKSTIYQWCSKEGVTDLCNWIEFDFSKPIASFEQELKKIPVVSGYVNCAGVLPIAPLKLQKVEDILDAVNINLISPILFTRELLKSKRIAKGGSIVYMSSINGLKVGSKAHSVYSATKAGIAGFAMSLANEVANIEIRVNTVAPGTVQTSMLEKTAGLIGDESFKNYLKQYPLGIGSPSSLVPLIIFLLDKNSSSWITGQSFIVDGGYTLN